jgi:hypothetical protein
MAALFTALWNVPSDALNFTEGLASLSANQTEWCLGWAAWMIAGLGLVVFYVKWGVRLSDLRWGFAAFLIATMGLTCDLLAGALTIGWFPERASPALANALPFLMGTARGGYTAGGILLTLGTKTGQGLSKIWLWTMGLNSLGFSAALFWGNPLAMALFAALLTLLFCPWVLTTANHLKTA